MCDALDRIFLTVCEVIGGVDGPIATRLMMVRVTDAIEDRVTQIDIRRRHIDFGAQDSLTVVELTRPHSHK